MNVKRPDVNGNEQGIYKKNKAYLLKTQEVCAICGGYVDKSLPFPHPMSASIDHIIPVTKGGRSTLNNLQLAHLGCNKAKGTNIIISGINKREEKKSMLPQSFDWSMYEG